MPPGRPIIKVEISLNNPEKSIEQLKQLSHSHGNKIKILALGQAQAFIDTTEEETNSDDINAEHALTDMFYLQCLVVMKA